MSGIDAAPESSISESESIEQQVESLVDRVDGLERENKQLREELHEERAMRQALIDTIGDVDPEQVAFGDVLVGRAPIEGMFKSRKRDFEALSEYVFGDDTMTTDDEIETHIEENGALPDQLEDGELRVTHGGLTEGVRQRLLPIHEMWIDVREGREEKIPHDNERRGARLFSRFIRKASGEHDTGVNADYGTYSMDSQSAREVLSAAGDMTKNGKSVTVKRSMKAVQSLSKRGDCNCDSLEECEHGVLVWDNDGGHSLVAQKDPFNALMGDVQAAIKGEIDASPEATDDAGNSAEDAVEDDTSAFDELDNASAVTSDDEDSVQGEVANSVVSHRNGTALDAGQTPTHDT